MNVIETTAENILDVIRQAQGDGINVADIDKLRAFLVRMLTAQASAQKGGNTIDPMMFFLIVCDGHGLSITDEAKLRRRLQIIVSKSR